MSQRAATDEAVDPAWVRRVDAQRLRHHGPPEHVEFPPRHGMADDPRYPSPSLLRAAVGMVIDLVLHLGIAVAVASQMPDGESQAAVGFLTFLVASFLHRVFVQAAIQTTLGKALTGIRVVRDDTGGDIGLGMLARMWFTGSFGFLNT